MSRPTIPPDSGSGRVLGDPSRLQDPARIARNALDLVVFELNRIELDFDVRVFELLPKAVSTLYVALDIEPEAPAHADALHESIAIIDEVLGLLRARLDGTAKTAVLAKPLEILFDARGMLVRRTDEVFDLQVQSMRDPQRFSLLPTNPESQKGKPFRASKGLPRLHALSRPRLSDEITREPRTVEPAPPPPPKIERPKDLDALKAFADAAKSGALLKSLEEPEAAPEPPKEEPPEYAFELAIEERDALRVLARDTLEDIGSLGNLRHPIPTESWLDQGPFEQRLLDNLDYFASLGGAFLPVISLYHQEADVPDAMRAFAVAFTLGCIEGSDTIGTALGIFKRSAPEEWSGFVDGFTLAPHPAIDEQLPEMLVGPNAKLAAVALDILARRGTLPDDTIDWLRPRNDRGLTLGLARALANNIPRDRAIPYLEELLWSDVDDEIWLAAAASGIRRGHGNARERVRDMLRQPPSLARAEGGIELLGLAGHPRDVEVLEYAARTYPTAKVARALGRFGHVSLIPLLIEMLSGDEPVAEAAGESLDRITNAGLKEVKEEEWDVGLPPELKSAAEAQGAPVPKRKVEKVILEREPWIAWWSKAYKLFDTGKKYRAGLPFQPIHVIDELEAKGTPVKGREQATFELSCLVRDLVRFRPDDWVARQKTQLADLRALIAPMTESGAWWFGGAPARPER